MHQDTRKVRTLFLWIGIPLVLLALGFGYSGWSSQEHIKLPLPTPAPVQQTFLLVGDTGTGLQGQYAVAEAMRAHCELDQHCQAAFIAGDVIYDKGVDKANDAQFATKFEDVYKELQIPFYIALGNHDYLGCTDCYREYTAQSTRWKSPASYYTQEFESVVFIVIDTEKFDMAQQEWLRAELKNHASKKKVIVGHRPILTYEVTKLKENWHGKDELENIICTEADYYVSGHAHVFEYVGRPKECTVKLLVVGTGGASLRQAVVPYPGVFAASTYGFVSMTTVSDTLSWKFISSTGEVVFSE